MSATSGSALREAERVLLETLERAEIYLDARGRAVFVNASEESAVCKAELRRRELAAR